MGSSLRRSHNTPTKCINGLAGVGSAKTLYAIPKKVLEIIIKTILENFIELILEEIEI
jgi:hypothetical protein